MIKYTREEYFTVEISHLNEMQGRGRRTLLSSSTRVRLHRSEDVVLTILSTSCAESYIADIDEVPSELLRLN